MKCKVCGSSQRKRLYSISGFQVIRCLNCGLIYRYPQPGEEELAQLYNKNYFLSEDPLRWGYRNYVKMKKFIIKTFEYKLKIIERYKKRGRILDIGCATGFFLEIAKKKGWETHGVELSDYAASYGREKMGLDIKTGDLKKAGYKKRYFDVVTMWDILEHTLHPLEELKEINRVLKRNGLVFITVSDIESFIAKIMGRRWFGFTKIREHLYFFSPRTLKMIVEKAGFDVLKIQRSGLAYSLEFLVSKLEPYSRFISKTLDRLLKKLKLENRALNFKFIDILIVARKGVS